MLSVALQALSQAAHQLAPGVSAFLFICALLSALPTIFRKPAARQTAPVKIDRSSLHGAEPRPIQHYRVDPSRGRTLTMPTSMRPRNPRDL